MDIPGNNRGELTTEGFSSAENALDFLSRSDNWREGTKYNGTVFTHRLTEKDEWIQEGDGIETNKTEEKRAGDRLELREHSQIISDLRNKGYSIIKKECLTNSLGKRRSKSGIRSKNLRSCLCSKG